MLKKKVAVLFFFLFSMVCYSLDNPTITIYVTGNFKYQENNISISIYEEGGTQAEANLLVENTQKEIENVLEEMRIDDFSIEGMNSGRGDDENYYTSKSLNITTPDDFDIDLFITSVLDAGASGYSNYNRFGGSMGNNNNSETANNMKEAVVIAKKKAMALANAFGGTLGEIVTITDRSDRYDEGINIEVTYEFLN